MSQLYINQWHICPDYVTTFYILNPNYLTNVTKLVTKFSNSKLYQSQKLPNKATLSRKWLISGSFMSDKKPLLFKQGQKTTKSTNYDNHRKNTNYFSINFFFTKFSFALYSRIKPFSSSFVGFAVCLAVSLRYSTKAPFSSCNLYSNSSILPVLK